MPRFVDWAGWNEARRVRRRFERLGELDVVDRFAGLAPAWVIEILFGVGTAGLALCARYLLDLWAQGAGPFSLIYPFVMIAALFGRWRAGLITLLVTFFYSWYALLPPQNSLTLANPADGPRLIVVAVTTLLTLMLADLFRAAVRRAALERQQELENRDLLLREIDHRMKNNFAIVASLLELQKRQEKSEEAKGALAAASARVQSFSGAHRSLYSDGADIHSVDMRDYLKTLIDYLSEALFLTGRVNVRFRAQSMAMPRDQAVSVGLVLNEVVTNAAKHAFADDETGEIVVEFSGTPKAWRLEVSDNGRGIPETPAPGGGGLGSRLITAFAQKAGAEVIVERPVVGARIVVRSVENGAA